MVNEVDRVLIIKTNSNNVAIPTDSLVVVMLVKHILRLLGVAYESWITTILSVLRPCKITDWSYKNNTYKLKKNLLLSYTYFLHGCAHFHLVQRDI